MANLSALIPSDVLAAMVEEALRKSLVAGAAVNNKYEGTISQAGDSVSIPVIGDVTVNDYTKGTDITYESLDAASQLLKVDQQKYFAFDIEDIDERQSIVNIASLYSQRAAYNMRDAIDQWLLQTVMSNGAGVKGATYGLGTTVTPIQVSYDGTTGLSVVEALGTIAKSLDYNHVPQEGRFAIIPPWFHALLVQAQILEQANGMAGDDAFANGRIGRAFGFNLYKSTNATEASYETGTEIFAGIDMATTYVGNLTNVEVVRRDKRMADGVRGLYVFGGKVTQVKGLAKAVFSAA